MASSRENPDTPPCCVSAPNAPTGWRQSNGPRKQQGRTLEEGCSELRIPYADPRERLMGILNYGHDAEVIASETLRKAIAERLQQTLKNDRK